MLYPWHPCALGAHGLLGSVFSSPGRSPGRAIVLPPASALVLAAATVAALAKSLMLKLFM